MLRNDVVFVNLRVGRRRRAILALSSSVLPILVSVVVGRRVVELVVEVFEFVVAAFVLE